VKFLIAFLTLVCCSALSQQNGNFIGTAQPHQQTAEEIAKQQAAQLQAMQPRIATELNGHALRKIDGKIHNLRFEGESKDGHIKYAAEDFLVVSTMWSTGEHFFALKNFLGDGSVDKYVDVRVIKAGVVQWNSTPLELWDCGTLLTPEEEKQKQAEFESAVIKIRQDQIEAARIKTFIANSNEVVRLKSAATGGSASAQFSLALHYLNGKGCETNKDLAIHWLKTASDGGNFGASNKLVELEQQK